MTTSAPDPATPSWRQVVRDPVLLVAFGFGSGLSPKAPGTAGTLLGLAIFPLLVLLPLPWYLLVVAITAIGGVWICDRAAQKLGVHDHSGIVVDEIAGIWLAMISFPATWPWLLGGFLLFRFFDIVKPWPIRWLDRQVSGGFGIMVDDLLAGVFTWLVLSAVRLLAG